jgi:tRNA(Ile2) C34 agmatinyltransferase TiaS
MLKKAAEIITNYSGEIYEDYSGRGMFGETTTAITFDSNLEFYEAIADVMVNEEQEQREMVADFLRNIQKDSLGNGIIIY